MNNKFLKFLLNKKTIIILLLSLILILYINNIINNKLFKVNIIDNFDNKIIDNNKIMDNNKIIGIAVLTNTTNNNIKGHIEFIQENNKDVEIILKIKGLSEGNHGFHIHEAGDLTDSCKSACSHFNPENKKHGGKNSKERHIGDLGNIIVDKNGKIKNSKFTDSKIKLKGKYSIIGRSVVIHENEDDLGIGGLDLKSGKIIDKKKYNESIKTGNAGSRIACGVIGYSKKMFC